MIAVMATRKNNNAVSVSDSAKAILDQFHQESKMPYAKIIEETMRWLQQQSDVVRCVVWGTLPKSAAPNIARQELERLALVPGQPAVSVVVPPKQLEGEVESALKTQPGSAGKQRPKTAHH